MIRFLFDTGICIELIRGRAPGLLGRLRHRRIGTIGISVITLAELLYGVAKSRDPARNAVALAHFCAPLEICPFDHVAGASYGEIRAALERAGTPIGPLDTLIAAHAVAMGATIVTNNECEFHRVRQVRVENWLKA